MAQVMEAETRHASFAASAGECLPNRISPHRPTVAGHEDPIRSGPGHHVLSQHRHDMRRDYDGPLARIRLRLGIKCSAVVLKQLDPVPANGDRPRHRVNVGQAQT
jgi:hypothetical protein